ncbi:uncharacterized protein L969DRAFT_91288 [Mixia osmundae IAM 14324]|uniref:SP-RING-type domain-containing protein n=1 Tax=Mixia osmundae (strain CBS 9802 / IAM 14324 / JCM 22182 / KY 12970) TaxID=764103 RepID=G7DSR5_MIXOS|nr:uncharacterized protein L969DRAFT_91288 [Mixia osmundae IAM 14324]KEI41805.1 hypothetical protein L969DRAFT_91288 [Mixia osmundae IAM 14324]GAA93623.1 hypothetical protein E5Q_00267 [Mixia osmundae IAM 14324]
MPRLTRRSESLEAGAAGPSTGPSASKARKTTSGRRIVPDEEEQDGPLPHDQQSRGQELDEEINEDAIAGKIDPEWLDRPLDRRVAGIKLQALIAAYHRLDSTANSVTERYVDAVATLCEAHGPTTTNDLSSDVEERKEATAATVDAEIQRADRQIRKFVDATMQLRFQRDAVKAVSQELDSGRPVIKPGAKYEAMISISSAAYDAKTPRRRYLEAQHWQNFRKNVWERLHEEAMPNLKQYLPPETGDEDDSDSDVELGASKQNFVCPITLRPLLDPVTSDKCGHSYDQKGIREYLTQSDHRGRPKECPTSGCNQMITLHNLSANRDLARRAANWERQDTNREETSVNDNKYHDIDSETE